MASTEPTGAPSSANPRVPSVRPRCLWTSGMCAVQDANSSPWTTNTAVTAILGQRVAVPAVVPPAFVSPGVVLVRCARSDTVRLHARGLPAQDVDQLTQLRRCIHGSNVLYRCSYEHHQCTKCETR